METDTDTMLEHYIAAALWSTNDESTPAGGEPLDCNYGPEDIHPDTLAKMRDDVERFLIDHRDDIYMWEGDTSPLEQAGHDFWLTRNGHGVGFWESEWTDIATDPGSRLDKTAKKFGEFDLYVGDDGMIHGN